jgi:hypothetical protein
MNKTNLKLILQGKLGPNKSKMAFFEEKIYERERGSKHNIIESFPKVAWTFYAIDTCKTSTPHSKSNTLRSSKNPIAFIDLLLPHDSDNKNDNNDKEDEDVDEGKEEGSKNMWPSISKLGICIIKENK